MGFPLTPTTKNILLSFYEVIYEVETCLFSSNKKKNEKLSFLHIKLSQKKNL